MTHAIVHLPGEPTGIQPQPPGGTRHAPRPAEMMSLYEWMTGRKPHDEAAAPTTAPSRPSLTIEVALTTHQVREPHDGDAEAT